jgi:hypothetical protein
VIATWGEVPEQIREIENKDDAYLLYPEYRGRTDRQDFWQDGRGVIGGWAMEYAGPIPVPQEAV